MHLGNQLKYYGIDISENMIRTATKNSSDGTFLCAMGHELPFKDGEIDLVFSVTVLQHMPREQQITAAEEMIRVTKASGKILVIEDILKRESPSAFMRPNSPEKWMSLFTGLGCQLVTYHYDKYFLLYSVYKQLKSCLEGIGMEITSTAIEKVFYYLSFAETYYGPFLPSQLASGICMKFIKQVY